MTVAPFPKPGQPQTLTALRKRLDMLAANSTAEVRARGYGTMLDRPAWGKDAFLEITDHPSDTLIPVSYRYVELWLGHYHIEIALPSSNTSLIRATVQIADRIARQALRRP